MPPKKTVPRKKVAKTKPVARKNAKQTKPKPKPKSKPKPTMKKLKRGGGEELTVIIGNFKFQLVRSHKYKTYDTVNIKSINITTKTENHFSVYRSGSCTFWRFVQHLFNAFEKGSDYVQTSFIHLKLQEFIDNNFDKIEVGNKIVSIDDIPDAKKTFNQNDVLSKKGREEHYDCFRPMSTLESGYCLNKTFQENATEFVRSMHMLLKKDANQDAANKAMIDKMINKVGEIEKEMFAPKYADEFELKHPDICKLIEMVNYYMSEMFTADMSKKLIYSKKVNFTDADNQIECNGEQNINSVCITCKQTKDRFRVHYMELKCTTPLPIEQPIVGNNIFLVLPDNIKPEENITEYGMYAKYVKVGMYASKALEYCDQSKLCKGSKCSKNYNALFHFMNLWPLNNKQLYSHNCVQASGITPTPKT
jgi:hypothetical protein